MDPSGIIVIVDDFSAKISSTKRSVQNFGFQDEDIITLGSPPGDCEWIEYVSESLEEIREERDSAITILLDHHLFGCDVSLYETDRLASKLFIKLINDRLREGDSIICNSTFPNEQFDLYRKVFFREREDYLKNEHARKVIKYKGVLIVMPGLAVEEGLREVEEYSELGRRNIEGSIETLK